MKLELLAHGYGIVEDPRVDRDGALYFSCARSGVYRRDPDGHIEQLFARTWVGGLALNQGGGLVVTGKTLARWDPETGALHDIFSEWEGEPLPGLNDLTVDRDGDIFVGVMGFDINVFDPAKNRPPPGSLFRVAASTGEATKLFDGVLVPNGIGFSPDERQLYQSDTMTHAVWVYDVAADKSVHDRRIFCQFRGDELPDGLAVDVEGAVWVAIARGDGEVVRVRPDGGIDRRIRVPSTFVTSLTFGGDDGTDLYVVTANNTVTADGSGAIFRTKVDVPGMRVPETRF